MMIQMSPGNGSVFKEMVMSEGIELSVRELNVAWGATSDGKVKDKLKSSIDDMIKMGITSTFFEDTLFARGIKTLAVAHKELKQSQKR